MKKLFIIALLSLVSITTGSQTAFAAITPTPTKTTSKATPTPSSNGSVTQIEQQINNLKDKIASQVAQLHLTEKKGFIGIVTDVSETQITIKDNDGNIHFVDVDELTKFDSPSAKSNFGISDITKNSTIGVLGIYNKDSRRLLARFVDVLTFPKYIRGAIAAIDKPNFTMTVVQNDGTQTTVEIEDVTKTLSYDKTAGSVKAGFSKAQVGERVYIVGFPDKQDPKQLIASRIILFPTLSINPNIGSVAPITPTAATPSATVAPTKKPAAL